MKYTKYLAAKIKAQGVPQLGIFGFTTLMNAIHLEGKIAGIESMQKRDPVNQLKYNIWIQDIKSKLEEITLKMEPEEFFKLGSRLFK